MCWPGCSQSVLTLSAAAFRMQRLICLSNLQELQKCEEGQGIVLQCQTAVQGEEKRQLTDCLVRAELLLSKKA